MVTSLLFLLRTAELGAVHADLWSFGHSALQGLRERRRGQQAAGQDVRTSEDDIH